MLFSSSSKRFLLAHRRGLFYARLIHLFPCHIAHPFSKQSHIAYIVTVDSSFPTNNAGSIESFFGSYSIVVGACLVKVVTSFKTYGHFILPPSGL